MATNKEVCSTCLRLHTGSQPCPRRVANAYQMQPLALVRLTDVDKEWMASHKVDVVDILEKELAERM